jgi:hypothetical protein
LIRIARIDGKHVVPTIGEEEFHEAVTALDFKAAYVDISALIAGLDGDG